MNPAPIPLALYVHFPWCVRKCPYCDFNSHALDNGGFAERRYIDALLNDLDTELARSPGRSLASVFFGGGTPSLLSGAGVERLLQGIRSLVPLCADAEITLEANPGTRDASRFSAYRHAGVNRLSIGVQSFDDGALGALGRIHSARDAIDAFALAQEAGFEDINLDLMYGLPGQSREKALDDLRLALTLDPTHVSWYQLTIEPNTAFHHRPPPALPGDDRLANMEEAGCALLADRFVRYEVSAYARDGRRCRHNLNYWRFGDYIGIGAGAHGKLTDAAGRVERHRKHRHPAAYMKAAEAGDARSGSTLLQDEDLVLEFMMNALRLTEGVRATLFAERTGLSLEAVQPRLTLARDRGLLEEDEDRIRATEKGARFLNDLLMIFA